jgi:tetratricopeptide (TPR) repeat protein
MAVYRPKVNEAAGRALAIDPRSAEAFAAMGGMELDPDKGASLLEQAIAINPSFATAYQWYGDAKGAAGDPEDAERQLQRAFELDPRSRIIGNDLAWWNLILGRTDDAFRLVEQMKGFAPDYNENLELEFTLLLISGQREAAEAVGKRLAEILNKKTPNLDPYLDLFGDAAQREAASEVLLSWPRDSRMKPDSPAILYEINLLYVLAVAGLYEPALKIMAYLAKTDPRLLTRTRAVSSLASFNCTADAQAIYASLPFPRLLVDYPCPESEGELP